MVFIPASALIPVAAGFVALALSTPARANDAMFSAQPAAAGSIGQDGARDETQGSDGGCACTLGGRSGSHGAWFLLALVLPWYRRRPGRGETASTLH